MCLSFSFSYCIAFTFSYIGHFYIQSNVGFYPEEMSVRNVSLESFCKQTRLESLMSCKVCQSCCRKRTPLSIVNWMVGNYSEPFSIICPNNWSGKQGGRELANLYHSLWSLICCSVPQSRRIIHWASWKIILKERTIRLGSYLSWFN